MLWTIAGSVGIVAVAVALLATGLVGLLVYWRRSLPPEIAHGGALESLAVKVAALEVVVAGLPSLWEDERIRSKRAQDASRSYRADAEKKLEEVEELLGEERELADEVRAPDGMGGGEGGVFPMPTRLGDATSPGIDERVAAVAHLLR